MSEWTALMQKTEVKRKHSSQNILKLLMFETHLTRQSTHQLQTTLAV